MMYEDNLQKAEHFFKIGKELVKQGEIEPAINSYKQAIELRPKMLKAYFELGKTFETNGDVDTAISLYLKSIEINPKFGLPYHRFLWINLNSAQLQQVLDCFHKVMDNSGNREIPPLFYTTLGDVLTRLDDFKGAVRYYQEAIKSQLLHAYPELALESNQLSSLDRKKPSFFIIGGMKCGTTSMYNYLLQHPQVISALRKEIHFFTQHFDRGIEWYLSQFPAIPHSSTAITGEATPCMSINTVWDRIHQYLPDVKIIVLLRNPVDRAYSHYNHTVKVFGLQQKFIKTISYDLENKENTQLMLKDDEAYLNVKSPFLSKGLYYFWLKKWMSKFSREQFLILNSEHLSKKTENVMSKTFDFLNLPDCQLSDYKKELKGSYKPLNDSLYQSLQDYYRPYNKKLEELIGINFNWS